MVLRDEGLVRAGLWSQASPCRMYPCRVDSKATLHSFLQSLCLVGSTVTIFLIRKAEALAQCCSADTHGQNPRSFFLSLPGVGRWGIPCTERLSSFYFKDSEGKISFSVTECQLIPIMIPSNPCSLESVNCLVAGLFNKPVTLPLHELYMAYKMII